MALTYTKMEGNSRGFYALTTTLAVFAFIGFICFMITYIEGHQVLGSSNAIPWGMPIIIAIYLIGLSAGLHILAFLIHILGRKEWKSVIRMAVFMAIILIFGAMVSIALDLGRPEKFWRLFMLFYMNNMGSMFAINAIFYSCYFASASIYLMALLANKEKLSKIMGMVAFCWAMATHGGTGAIFGLISTRATFFSGLKPFEFILAALTSSLALLVVVIVLIVKITGRQIKDDLVISLGRFVAAFLCGLILLIWIGNLTHGYMADREALTFLLAGPFSFLFWGFQVLLGEVIPLVILFHPKTGKTVNGVVAASILIVVGVFFERLNLIIPGLAYPQHYFPGEIEGIYGAVGSFPITPVEFFLSLGIFALLALIYILGLKNLELLPVGENVE